MMCSVQKEHARCKMFDEYESYKRVRKPIAKPMKIMNGGVRRLKDKIRDEIEEGIEEWEEGDENERNNAI